MASIGGSSAARRGIAELSQAFARMGRPSSARARRGLFAGKDVLFGNQVSHSNRKTRRTFKPNSQRKGVWSDALQEMVPFNMTTTTLRHIDKVGGLDNYLLQTPDQKLASESGINVKKRVLAAMARALETGVVPGPKAPGAAAGAAGAAVAAAAAGGASIGGSVAAMGAADAVAGAVAGGGGGGVVG